jgi:hypothetical protein
MQNQMCAKTLKLSMRTAAIDFAMCCMLTACAPTYAPRLDAPAMPTVSPAPLQCPALANLAPPPQLPDVDGALLCPAGSAFVACFTLPQDAIRRRRFQLLHDDRDYCRDAYAKAVNRVSQFLQ